MPINWDTLRAQIGEGPGSAGRGGGSAPKDSLELMEAVAEAVPVRAGVRFDLTGDQKRALDALVAWVTGSPQGYITLGGYAGTGKTTLLAELCHALPQLRVHFCAFTMKAASVLLAALRRAGLEAHNGRRRRGSGGAGAGYPVTTIHGLLYAPLERVWCVTSGELLGYVDAETPRKRVCGSQGCRRAAEAAPGFSGAPEGSQGVGGGSERDCPTRTTLDWERKDGGPVADLVVLDEASMVSGDAWNDILSLGLPVLAIGDHGQLPPVKSAFALLADGVDLELTEITRQGKDSAIIALASEIRHWQGTSARREAAEYGVRDGRPESYVAKINMAQMGSLPTRLGDGTDPVWVCGYNRTRGTWNGILRGQRGLSGPVAVGDRVICLRNTLDTYNGQLARVLAVHNDDRGRGGVRILELEPEDPIEKAARKGQPLVVKVPIEQFGREKTMGTDELNMRGLRDCQLWDFGYVLTVHKSQGSTFSNVVVLEERLPGPDEQHRRWLYTAVTRARHSVVIVK